MEISLINRTNKCHTRKSDKKILYHLSLDRCFENICSDIKKREYFLSVISNITDDSEDIKYRQAVLMDFQFCPDLFSELNSLCARFDEFRHSQNKNTADEFHIRLNRSSSDAALKNIVQSWALCLRRALLFVKAFGELLSGYPIKSSGLNELYRACRELYENDAFENVLHFCQKYENFSLRGFLDFRLTLNERGHISDYTLIDHRYIHITDPELKKSGFSWFRKTEEAPQYPCFRFYPADDEYFEKLTVSALSDLSKLFSDLSKQIFERFSNLYDELGFYDVALKYIAMLAQKKVPCCYPILSNGTAEIIGLYDLYLLVTRESASEIVPNNFKLNACGGMIIFGDNGKGKTVYLRSIGIMQILAQAGLPLPCSHAVIFQCTQLATQFSEAEKDLQSDNGEGRFEQEVRELADMVDQLESGALVLLNETFQTTEYEEGANGLYHLLEYFSESQIAWILVSHLRQLEKMFEPNKAKIVYMRDEYKISEK